MKRITTLFFSILTCGSVMAQVGTISPDVTQKLMPKPAFTITYDKEIGTFADDKAAINAYRYSLRGKIDIKDNTGKSYSYAIGEVTNNSINFVLQDLEVLPANATVTVTVAAGVGEAEQTFTYTVEDYYTIHKGDEHFSFVASKKNTLRIGEGVKLLVDRTLKCKQLIVEPNAGITISEKGSLQVFDTAYFLPNVGEIEGMPFLINKGSYSANGTVFMRDLPKAELMYEISSPVKEFSAYAMSLSDMEDHEYGDIEWGSITAKKYFWNGWRDANTWTWYDYDETTKQNTNIKNDWPFYVYPYWDNMVLRMKGELNTDYEYVFEKNSIGSYLTSSDGERQKLTQLTKMINTYPASIDVRSMYENNRIEANSLYIKKDITHINNEYVYNLNSGLTTYDGPMSYGYLFPNLTNADDYTSEKIVATEIVNDLATQETVRLRYATYDENSGKYVESAPKYPYIRFYCNYVNNPIEKGKRSVCVVYFVEDAAEQAEMRTNINTHIGNEELGGNVKYDAPFSHEYNFDDDNSYAYPYIVAKKIDNNNRNRLSIASYNYPTEDTEIEVMIGLMADKGTSDKMEVGILDYYLPGIVFENADDEAEDLLISRNNKNVQCDINEGTGADNFKNSYQLYSGVGVHCERTFTLRFRLAKEGEEAPATDESLFEPIDDTVTECDFAASGAEPEQIVSKITYKVNVATDITNGTVTVDKAEASKGETVSIIATPTEGYKLTSLSVDGGSIEVSEFNTFIMPGNNVNVTATFELISGLAVTAVSEGNGKISVSNTDAQYGETIKINVKPDDGYELDKIVTTPELTISDAHEFTMPNTPVTVTASFKAIEYTITIGSSENGSVELSQTTAKVGDLISTIVIPNEGYRVGAFVFSDGKTTYDEFGRFVMPANDLTVTAIFTPVDDYYIVPNSTEGGALTIVDINGSITSDAEENEKITLNTYADEGYELVSLTATRLDNNTELTIDADNTFIMPAANVRVSAVFALIKYSVNIDPTINGEIKVNKAEANKGDEITITATPNRGYKLVSLKVNNGSVNVDEFNTFTMPAADVTITAVFAELENKAVVVTATEHGKASVSSNDAKLDEVIKIIVSPDEGYELDKITTTPELTITNNTFVMPAENVEVTVTFKLKNYNVTIGNIENGTIEVDKSIANYGDVVTITATPIDGYELDKITVDGQTIDGNTFTMPAKDVSVLATFNHICQAIELSEAAENLFDWILVVNKKLLSGEYTFADSDVEWYKVNGEKDDWCYGVATDDEKMTATGLYYTGDKALTGEGRIYAVIKLTEPAGKYIISDDFDFSGNKSLKLTPTAVKHGQILRLAGLPDTDAVVKVYNISGTVMQTINTNGAESITFQSESADGIYIVNVYVGEVMKGVKYIVVK